ncbi:sugar kinase [Sphingopyxis kveilinensis]|uniref:sugar kinase n=1 Tax=Sphingopyxis kveilinensis TaxID=3114367 RepID=UPI0030CE3B33
MGHFVSFGEALLRLSSPRRELLLQTPRLDIWVGGAEANVAVQLAHLGQPARFVSAVPQNELGAAVVTFLRGSGVCTEHVQRREGRMGLYFSAAGAGFRAPNIVYDREHSSFARAPATAWDWAAILSDADRFHLSGITPALGPDPAESAICAARAAIRLGVPLSFDCNFRSSLWEAWDSEPRPILSELIAHADILFGNHRDVSLLLGTRFSSDGPTRRREAAEAAFDAFPRLKTVASTARHVSNADTHFLTARIDTRDGGFETEPFAIAGIVDRIGTGDAFAAGVLHALKAGEARDDAARTGLALAALKHSIPGDASLFSNEDVAQFWDGASDIRR